MVALKAKTLSLPHLSLSRTSSPSRSSSLNSTSSTPTSTAPTSPATTTSNGGTFSFSNPLALDRKKSKSKSPKQRPIVDSPPALDPITPIELASASNPLTAPPATASTLPADPKRRSSFGASLSAFANPSSRSASPAPKSTSTPAGLTLTPANAQRSTSENSGQGLKPLRAVIAKTTGLPSSGGTKAVVTAADEGGALPTRSKSSDRAEGIAAAAAVVGGDVTKKKGVMGTVRGLALGQSASQPAQSRSASSGSAGGGGGAQTNGVATPTLGSLSGAVTPSHAHSAAAGNQPQLHQLAESYVSKVSLKLGETVNRVFMPSPAGVAGQQADKLEGAFFVPSSALQETTGGKGRPCPRIVKSRDFGEMVVSELHAALHDSYLLRTILRSSVLKSLSLFLSRLSALLLVPTSPSDPSFSPPLFLTVCRDPKAQDSDAHFASNIPLPLRYNLHIVRCASIVKQHLVRVADPANGFPSFVEETLRPWRVKLAELIARVMNPIVSTYRNAINDACVKSRIEGGLVSASSELGGGEAVLAGGGARGRANSQERGGDNLAVTSSKMSATSQLRSLSLGRSSTPTPLASTLHSPGASAIAGPGWLREATVVLDVCAKLFDRLDAKTDADRWAVAIASAAVWKGMLGCSARKISEDGTVPSTPAPSIINGAQVQSTGVPAPQASAPTKSRLLGGVKKTSPSPPASPPLPAVELAGSSSSSSTSTTSPAPSTVAFVRLISDLELFEHRLTTFLSATISSPQVIFHPSAAPVDPCPGAPSCGLCKTGRTFDEESDSSDEEADQAKAGPPAGRESRLALSAMREAMQALSAFIVVVRASRDLTVIRDALKIGSDGSLSTKPAQDPNAPLTPSDLFALGPHPPSSTTTTTTTTTMSPSSTSITIVSPSPAHPRCPTLHSALLEIPPLVILHLVLSRLPPSLGVRLPHELWNLAGGWTEYERELRGFAAGEEWAGEVAWEMKGEVARVVQCRRGEDDKKWTKVEKVAIETLEATVVKVARDAA